MLLVFAGPICSLIPVSKKSQVFRFRASTVRKLTELFLFFVVVCSKVKSVATATVFLSEIYLNWTLTLMAKPIHYIQTTSQSTHIIKVNVNC